MAGERQIGPFVRQFEPDYEDNLEPGYRFRPTDLEIIVDLLKKKIETGSHPKCRLHEVDLYEHHPKVLSDGLRSHEGKWYFLTSRERKYRNGNIPNRRTRDGLGFWKASQKATVVYDDQKRAVGNKTSLAYHEGHNKKTSWLMHEYTANLPNLTVGSNGNMWMDWVMCKVYNNKENNQTSRRAEQVQRRIQEDVNEEQNQVHDDEPSPRRRRLSLIQETNQTNDANHVQIGETNQTNNSDHVQIQETNHHSGNNIQMVEPVGFMFDSNQQLLDNNIGRDIFTIPAELLQTNEPNHHSGNDIQMASPVGFMFDSNQQPVDNNNYAQDIFTMLMLHRSLGISYNRP